MFCRNCGRPLGQGAQFCANCGAAVPAPLQPKNKNNILLTLIVGFALILGGVLPLAAKVVKLDPAVMASPFITTIVDALSLLVYFMFAKSMLHL